MECSLWGRRQPFLSSWGRGRWSPDGATVSVRPLSLRPSGSRVSWVLFPLLERIPVQVSVSPAAHLLHGTSRPSSRQAVVTPNKGCWRTYLRSQRQEGRLHKRSPCPAFSGALLHSCTVGTVGNAVVMGPWWRRGLPPRGPPAERCRVGGGESLEAVGLGGTASLLPPVGTLWVLPLIKIPSLFFFPNVPLYLKAIKRAIFAEKTGRE